MTGIQAIAYHLPEKILTNEELAEVYQDWSAEKILTKTGIAQRHITVPGETAGDLAEAAARKLFEQGAAKPGDIDFILLATQTPDYLLPTTACILQDRLGIPQSAGALDFNLGCSAYPYGLAMARGLIETGVAKNVLFLTAETYTKHINPLDKSTRTIFGDGAAATLVSGQGDGLHTLDAFRFGTDGSGWGALVIPVSGARNVRGADTSTPAADENGSMRSKEELFMEGTDVFNFTIRVVPPMVEGILGDCGLQKDDIDLFVFHQANQFMLEFLRKKIKIPKEKFFVDMQDIGNTVSATVPISLARAQAQGRLKKGDRVLLAGFGVGLSWSAAVLTW